MDPLSITASAIAVLGAFRQAVKSAERLRAVRRAPEELKLLLKEVTDLSELLKDAQLAQRPPAYEETDAFATPIPNPSPTSLDWHISRTSTVLQDLDSLVEDHASRTDRRRLDHGHWGWHQGRRKANALREELKVLRLNLAASLGANTSHSLGRLEAAIQRSNEEQSKTNEAFSRLVRSLVLDPPTSKPPPLERSPEHDSLSCTFRYPIKPQKDASTLTHVTDQQTKMTRSKPQVAKASKVEQSMQVYARKSTAQCKDWCSCACHKKHVLKIKDPSTIGSFSLAYSGLPWVTASCDEKSCRSRSVPSIAVTFQFPNWVWRRHLLSSFSYTPIRGPDLNLRLPRVVDWSSKLWGYGITGDLQGVQELYSLGMASPWDVNALGGSLLHYATDRGHWDMCKFLVGQGTPIETEDDLNNSPSAMVWDKILAAELTDNDSSTMASVFSDTDYLQTRQFTILHKIVLGFIPRTLESELEYSTKNLDAVDSSGRTCVSWAAARGDIEALKVLLGYDADPNLTDGRGCSPLHHASSIACINLLVDAGARLCARNVFGHTPLHTICRGSGSLTRLKRFLELGVDKDATDHADETALMNAIYNRHTACALYLIEKGADINITDSPNGPGNGPINFAIMQNDHQVLQQLLERGVKYTDANSYGATILHTAAQLADSKTVEILKQHGLKFINVAQMSHDDKTARDMLEERTKDDEDVDFHSQFEELLNTVGETWSSEDQHHTELDSVKPIRKTSCLTIKDATIIGCTSVYLDDEANDQGLDDDDLVHNAAVFFDAVENVCEILPTVGVAA